MQKRRGLRRWVTASLLLGLSWGCESRHAKNDNELSAHPHGPEVAPPSPPVVTSLRQPAVEKGTAYAGRTRVTPVAEPKIRARILVISADGTEAVLPAIRETLEAMGTPYTLHIAADARGTLTRNLLWSGQQAHFQAVFLTTGSLAWWNGSRWASALTDAEWQALRDFEAAFRIREVIWYARPQQALGFGPAREVDTSGTPLEATLTPEGSRVFSSLNTEAPIRIGKVWTYRARPLEGSTPLLADAEGNALAAIHQGEDGRETLSCTFDGSRFLTHTLALSYGLVNWATRGVFVGQRRVTAARELHLASPEKDGVQEAALETVPRRPTNLFFNVSTPAEWVAQYNFLYESFWRRPLSYEEILDKESDMLVMELLRGDPSTWLFHRANERHYAPGKTLLTDLLETTFAKYSRLSKLPIGREEVEKVANRVRFRKELAEARNLEVVIEPDRQLTVRSDSALRVPITGVDVAETELYGGQPTSWIPVRPGVPITYPLRRSTGI